MSRERKGKGTKRAISQSPTVDVLNYLMSNAERLAARMKLPATRIVLESRMVNFLPDDVGGVSARMKGKDAGHTRGVFGPKPLSNSELDAALRPDGAHEHFIFFPAGEVRRMAEGLNDGGPAAMKILVQFLITLEHECLHACGFSHGEEMAQLLERIHGHMIGTPDFLGLDMGTQRSLIQAMQANVQYVRSGGIQAHRSGETFRPEETIPCLHETERRRSFDALMMDWP